MSHSLIYFCSGQIEKANLAELDWALANMSGSRSKKPNKSSGEDWVVEAEAKGSKDKDEVIQEV